MSHDHPLQTGFRLADTSAPTHLTLDTLTLFAEEITVGLVNTTAVHHAYYLYLVYMYERECACMRCMRVFPSWL